MYADIPITDNIQRIMFEIDIDTRIQNTKAYASIRHLSNFYDENEVLIMLGSIFKIKSVIYNKKEQMWIAHLVMCSEDDFELRDLLKQIKKETKAGVTSVGFLLYRQGKFDKAKIFFLQLLHNKSLSLNNYDLVNCFRGLGSTERGLKDYDAALLYHRMELWFVKKLNNSLAVAKTYYIIAQTYFCKNYYDLALGYSIKALVLLLFDNHDEECVYIYHIIAMIYRERKQFDLSYKYQKKTLNIQKHLLTKNHPELGITYQNVAIIFDGMKNYQQANDYYNRALSIFHKSCPQDHPNIKAIENKLSLLQHKRN
ncbi:unnamed protein product [Rotaria sp. Silwood1]|nr:unnamed protein product [Rotaria sp. Silwood1]CAF3684377.1 unnamed protein product [Rotaria sp. Silwood1]